MVAQPKTEVKSPAADGKSKEGKQPLGASWEGVEGIFAADPEAKAAEDGDRKRSIGEG